MLVILPLKVCAFYPGTIWGIRGLGETYQFSLLLLRLVVPVGRIPETPRQLPQGLVGRLPRHGRS